MSRTLIAREMFRGTTPLNSGTPGAFSAVYGSIGRYRVGPKLTTDTDDGSHGDVDSSQASGAYMNLVDGTTGSHFCIEVFYWNGELNTSNYATILRGGVNFGGSAPWFNEELGLYRTPGGDYLFRFASETDAVVLESLIPRHRWIRLYVYATYLGSFNWTYRFGYQVMGGAEVDVFNRTNRTITNITHFDVIGIGNDGAGVKNNFAVGGFSLTQITSAADFGPCTDITAPTDASHTWYVSAVAVSPGDGTISSPLTQTQLKAALAGSGILGNTTGGAGTGDHVIFLNDGVYHAPEVIATVRQRGLWLDGNGAMLYFLKTVSGTWTRPDAGGAPNVWAINDSELSPVSSYVPILCENSNGLTAVAGANFAAVEATLQSTEGSFWSDGTTMYVHPYGGTNPNTDGKTYERSTATSQECGIQFWGKDQWIHNFAIDGVAYWDKTSLQNVGGLAVSDAAGRDGGLVTNIKAERWGKHGRNFTAGTTFGATTRDCTFERGWPFGFGAQSCAVDYATSGSQDAVLTNVSMRATHNGWAVGPNSAGQAQAVGGSVYLSHTQDSGHLTNEFTSITFTRCLFGGGTVSFTSGVDVAVSFNDCDSFNFSGYSGAVSVSNTQAPVILRNRGRFP